MSIGLFQPLFIQPYLLLSVQSIREPNVWLFSLTPASILESVQRTRYRILCSRRRGTESIEISHTGKMVLPSLLRADRVSFSQ